MNVTIIYGGKSGEHEVSINSACSVIKNIDKKHNLVLIGIDKSGVWHLQDKSVLDACLKENKLLLDEKAPIVAAVPGIGLVETKTNSQIACDVIFPVIHGTFCEDGTIQGLLECIGIPYIGAGTLGSAICMDKVLAKDLWRNHDIPLVPGISVYKSELQDIDKVVSRCEKEISYPMFVKPSSCGSSVGTSKANNKAELIKAINLSQVYDSTTLIEKFIDAREVECSVIGNTNPIAFRPGELAPSHAFYDYDAKYNDPQGAKFNIPANIPEENEIMKIAIKAYIVAKLSGMSRVDFFIDRKTNKIYLNEINTIPGFTSISMFPKMCEAGGLNFTDLIEKLISYAIEKHSNSNSLKYSY